LAIACLDCRAQAHAPIPAGPLLVGPIHFEFAIYYPESPTKQPMTVLKERMRVSESVLKLVTSVPDKPPAGAVLVATLNTTAQKNYRPPDLQMVQRFGRGLTRDQAQALQRAEQALILDFAHPASMSASALRTALQLTEQVARDTNGLLWDEETREIFTPDEWHKRRLDSWAGDTPDVLQHIVIHTYKSDKLVRAITLGMSKFGFPDVVVSDFSWSLNQSVGNLINLFAQSMVEGSVMKTSGMYDLDLRSVNNANVRQGQLATLKPNAAAIAKLSLVKGAWEDGDPRNRLVEIRFDRYPGPDHYARQEAMLRALFGSEDSVQRVKHTNELLEASRAANAKLPTLREAFRRGLKPGEYIQVKAPFAMPDGGNEWMWVEVTSWNGDAISGLLKNEPANIPSLHGGQMVKVSQSKVFDYIRRDADGHEDGNETGKVLKRLQNAGK
jgi:uncharacterized protein YegJ (DUF2314 family)